MYGHSAADVRERVTRCEAENERLREMLTVAREGLEAARDAILTISMGRNGYWHAADDAFRRSDPDAGTPELSEAGRRQ